jgi:hypothetical protein
MELKNATAGAGAHGLFAEKASTDCADFNHISSAKGRIFQNAYEFFVRQVRTIRLSSAVLLTRGCGGTGGPRRIA